MRNAGIIYYQGGLMKHELQDLLEETDRLLCDIDEIALDVSLSATALRVERVLSSAAPGLTGGYANSRWLHHGFTVDRDGLARETYLHMTWESFLCDDIHEDYPSPEDWHVALGRSCGCDYIQCNYCEMEHLECDESCDCPVDNLQGLIGDMSLKIQPEPMRKHQKFMTRHLLKEDILEKARTYRASRHK